MKPMICFIQMGGTIDKAYPKSTGGYAFEIADAAFLSIIEDLQASFDFQTKTICQKDSQDITKEDRNRLLDYIEKQDTQQFVITHGTDTMKETGLFLSNISNKTIVLTGALKPAAFKQSDAPIQLGAAISACQLLSPGIYIAMNGIVKPIEQIGRDVNTGKFI